MFDRSDKNHDGALTRAEIIKSLRGDPKLRALLVLPERVSTADATQKVFEGVFQQLDLNDDRRIEKEEFRKFCTKIHPEFAQQEALLQRTKTGLSEV